MAAFDPDEPGCLIIDIRLQSMSGLELQADLVRRGIETPIIMISRFADVPDVVDAIKRGAIDFLEKPFRDEQLLERVHVALELDAARRTKNRIVAETRQLLDRLTNREDEIMKLLARGLPVKQIGVELGISPKTVHVHRTHIFENMRVRNAVELLALLYRVGKPFGNPAA